MGSPFYSISNKGLSRCLQVRILLPFFLSSSSFVDCSHREATQDDLAEKKYLVFHSALMELFATCKICLEECTVETRLNGTCIIVTAACPRKHKFKWASQPYLEKKPLGNMLLCGGILFSGSCPTKVLRLLQQIGLCMVSESTYYDVQEGYLWPAINAVRKCLITESV